MAGRHLQMRLTTLATPNLGLGDLELTNSIALSAHLPWFVVCLPGSGQVRVNTPGASTVVANRCGAVVAPGEQAKIEYLSPRCHIRTVIIERTALEDELTSMLGHTVVRPLHFESDLGYDKGDPLDRSLQLLTGEADQPGGLATYPTIAPRLGRLVIAGLLTSVRHNYSEELLRPTNGHQPKAIRLAIEAIEDHAADIVTVADIARAVGLSVRGLHAGFSRHVGMPPMKYLRQVRLARAHLELRESDPGATTATAVAHRWGFPHYSRFVAEYRRVHGCTPADTLRSVKR
jgi:AraC-like DNA-binding protein